MAVMKISINNGWEVAFADHGAILSLSDCNSLIFYPATVPGTNLTDLQAAGLVERETSASYEASFAPYKYQDFIYRAAFRGEEAAGCKHVFLCFDGLDTVCEIFLNGQKLAAVENAYIGYRFNVAGRLNRGNNELCLIFRSPVLEAEKRKKAFQEEFASPHLNYQFAFIRKPAYSFFWDWGPQIPVSGIYRPVYVEAFDEAAIRDFSIRYNLEGHHVSGTVTVEARGNASGKSAVLEIAGQEYSAAVCNGTAEISFMIDDVRLWYPNGEGKPYLYDMEIMLKDKDIVLDSRRHRIGFRTVELIRDARKDRRGDRFLFKINGREIFCRGYNWVPVDSSIPRGYYDLYRGNLDLAAEGHVNMLRVWGGGYYEDDEFYRICDERGIMVWQDGCFACSPYPDTDPHFMKQVEEELKYNIKRLRNYTSLVLWCGENECHWGYEEWGWKERSKHFYGTAIYDKLFSGLIAQLDPDRLYWNGSPYAGEPGIRANDERYGDYHLWDLHTHTQDYTGYAAYRPSFVSETGIQSLPDLRTALTIGGPEDRHIQSFVFDIRNHFESPSKNERLLKFTAALFRISEDFDKAVILSNLAHAEYLKVAIERWRAQAYDCAGLLIWQFNDCWPAISWAAVDYNLIPKACHYYMKRAFTSDMITFQQGSSIIFSAMTDGRGELHVISERDGYKRGQVELRIIRIDGEELESRVYPVIMNGRGSVGLGEIILSEYEQRRFDCIAVFTLTWDDGQRIENHYTLSRPKHMRLPQPRIELRQVSDTALAVSSDIFAKGVYLFHPDPKLVLDDNYFDLLPGKERLIKAAKALNAGEMQIFNYHH